MHRNGHARKAFEQNPLGLKTGCNECTRARALNEYISQRRTPSGDAINLCGSVAAPPHCARDRMVDANAGVATSPAVRNLPSDSILRRAKSPVNFKPVDNSCKLQPSLHRVAQIVVLQFISAMHRGGSSLPPSSRGHRIIIRGLFASCGASWIGPTQWRIPPKSSTPTYRSSREQSQRWVGWRRDRLPRRSRR